MKRLLFSLDIVAIILSFIFLIISAFSKNITGVLTSFIIILMYARCIISFLDEEK
jgi:hypothetical protein